MALIDRRGTWLGRITARGGWRLWLATQGHVVNRKRVRRLMRLAGIGGDLPATEHEQAGGGSQVHCRLFRDFPVEAGLCHKSRYQPKRQRPSQKFASGGCGQAGRTREARGAT